MVDIKELPDCADCLFRAHVSFVHHSDQYACFGTEQAARHWADSLARRILEADTIRALREAARF